MREGPLNPTRKRRRQGVLSQGGRGAWKSVQVHVHVHVCLHWRMRHTYTLYIALCVSVIVEAFVPLVFELWCLV